MDEDWELTTLLGGWGVGGREEFQKREAGLCLGIRPIYYSISLVKPSWEFWVCNLISRSAFFVVLGKDDQELGLCPCYLLCKAGGALVGAQQAFLSLSRGRSWTTPLQGCSVRTHAPARALTLAEPISPRLHIPPPGTRLAGEI